MSIYWDAVEKFGEDIQFIIAMEECGELVQAISKVIRKKGSAVGADGMRELANEVADVQIMLNQLKEIIAGYGVWDYEAIFEEKLERMRKRVEGEESFQ